MQVGMPTALENCKPEPDGETITASLVSRIQRSFFTGLKYNMPRSASSKTVGWNANFQASEYSTDPEIPHPTANYREENLQVNQSILCQISRTNTVAG